MVKESIISLLFEHNCVILPGYGGFITNRIQSRINEVQHRVEPPRKVIAFNKNLTQSDGLLAEYISRSYSVSFDEAMEKISHFVTELQYELKINKHAVLKSIGDFYVNSEGSLVFIPEADINFARDTYGLFPVTIRKIAREEETETKDPRSLQIKSPRTKRKLNRKIIYGVVLITIPMMLGFISQQSGVLQKAGFNINDLFPKTQVVETNNPVTEIKKEANSGSETVQQKENDQAVKSQDTLPQVQSQAVTTPDVPEAITESSTKSTWHYHIIGGSFAYPENASKFLAELQSKGYQAYVAGINQHGLTMVSFAGFATEQEALMNLASIREKENAEAWLLNN
jgi:cell division septation protein DedD